MVGAVVAQLEQTCIASMIGVITAGGERHCLNQLPTRADSEENFTLTPFPLSSGGYVLIIKCRKNWMAISED